VGGAQTDGVPQECDDFPNQAAAQERHVLEGKGHVRTRVPKPSDQQKISTNAIYYTRGLVRQLINRRVSVATRYYHHDAIGSVVGLTDSTGALTDTYSYEAFGNVRARTGTNT